MACSNINDLCLSDGDEQHRSFLLVTLHQKKQLNGSYSPSSVNFKLNLSNC